MADQKPDEPAVRSEISKSFEELEQLGLIRRTGAHRNGLPVYTVTERGRCACLTSAESKTTQ